MPHGKLLVLEGIDGAGKSIQTERLQQHLTQQGIECLATREPGGVALAESIRTLLLQHPTDAISEALLFNAARREHARKLIAPALSRGAWVVCDRFALSGFAYQGAGGADIKTLETLHQVACGDLDEVRVDIGFMLDLPPALAQKRLTQRFSDKEEQATPEQATPERANPFESRGLAFFERVQAIMLERVQREQSVWHVVDARAEIEQVAEQIRSIVKQHLFPKNA